MRASSIIVKSIDGKLYKITDLIKGIKEPLTDTDLKNYDMYPQSGVFKDVDGKLVDLVEILTTSSKVQIQDIGKPENPTSNVLYVDKNARSIAVYDDENNEWIELGNGNSDTTTIFSPENALDDSDVLEVINIFLQHKKGDR